MNKLFPVILLVIGVLLLSCEVRFSPEVVNTFKFLISVTTQTDNNFNLIEAHLIIKNEDEIVYEVDLPAETSSIELREDIESFTIIIKKDGYNTWQETFTEDELKNYEDSPLIVVLKRSS